MSVFRPSARVTFTLRTEEFDDTDALDQLAANPFTDAQTNQRTQSNAPQSPNANEEDSTQNRLRLNQERLQELEQRRENLPPETYEVQREEIRRERDRIMRETENNADVSQPPLAISGQAPDDRTVFGNIQPRNVRIERNGLTTAGTASIELNYLDAPFDPRILRAAAVEILIGVVPAEDFEAGTERGERRADGSLKSIIGKADDGTLQGATRFVGYVDDWGVRYSSEGDTVQLDCRDMSAILRDTALRGGESIDLSLPIDRGVSQFLNEVSNTTQGVSVVYEGDGTAPVPGTVAPQSRRERRGRQQRRGRRGNERMSLWDHITDVVQSLGLIPIVRDFDVILISPRTLFSTLGVRRMVYGINLKTLEFSRRLQGIKVPTIEVRAYDSELGRVRWARYPVRDGEQASGILGRNNPPRALRANEVTPSGANPDESIRTMNVSGVVDPGTLENIARSAFEQIGRQEIEGMFETSEVSSVDESPDLADLLQLQSGDSIEVLLAAGTQQSEENENAPNTSLSILTAMSRRQRREYFRAIGWSERVASQFAALQDATGFQTVFRVQDVRITFDKDDGVKTSVGFINYITVREEDGT
jgi:hypothetical protein